jgi:hypothetical protein
MAAKKGERKTWPIDIEASFYYRLDQWCTENIKNGATPEIPGIFTDLYNHKELCKEVFKEIKSDHKLEIGKSPIPGAGTGLFAKSDIEPYDDIYKSNPLIAVPIRTHPLSARMCDYCFGVALKRPTFFATMRQLPLKYVDSSQFCNTCKVAKYCSKVVKRLPSSGFVLTLYRSVKPKLGKHTINSNVAIWIRNPLVFMDVYCSNLLLR